mgnify:CR=1 FL=1
MLINPNYSQTFMNNSGFIYVISPKVLTLCHKFISKPNFLVT